jgi:nucleoside-diphosphate-sugar epimerase
MTRDGIFVTGGSGFVGRRLLPELRKLGRPVFALDRSGSLAAMPEADGITVVTGDLLDPAVYRAALSSCDVVVHLAATTGAASATEHHRVNAHGTEVLLGECRAAGVTKILFVSSIATTFPANAGYHYADAKRRAEDAVSQSGLRFTILRPTVIGGPGSPNLKALEKLALLPFIVLPGSGRARVQPIDVNDVARSIADWVRRDTYANEVVELGGPKVLTMEAHLQEIRRSRTGRTGKVVRVPLPLLSVPLRVAEAVGLGRWLPVTAGQLSSFRFDGVTADHRLGAGPGSHPSAGSGWPEPAEGQGRDYTTLAGECRVFARYLLGCDADAYVIDQYAAANASLGGLSPASRFDSALLGFARMSPLFARLADSYASLFCRTAALRKRLVLLLAILETRAPFHHTIDRAVGGATPLLLGRLSIATALALVSLMAGTLILAPTRVVLAAMPGPSTRGARSGQGKGSR